MDCRLSSGSRVLVDLFQRPADRSTCARAHRTAAPPRESSRRPSPNSSDVSSLTFSFQSAAVADSVGINEGFVVCIHITHAVDWRRTAIVSA